MDERTIDGFQFLQMVQGGAENLRAHAQEVNDLNVFPIPDGDTGENMSLTIEGGLRTVASKDLPIGKMAQSVADGMLMSARGNSGVILSQLFAGMAAGLKDKEKADIGEVTKALQTGVDFAYEAVVNPTEGTILTVAREAAEKVAGTLNENTDWKEFTDTYRKALWTSLQNTPELLQVLKDAGVIDSGGAGLYYLAEGACRKILGEECFSQEKIFGAETEEHMLQEKHAAEKTSGQTLDFSKFNEYSVMEYGYCTEFLLQLQRCKGDPAKFSLNELIAFLDTIGDSIVAFQNGTVVKVHVHTMTPGKVLEHCRRFGEFLTVKIENMTLQHNNTDTPRERKKFATVAVAFGEGIQKTFRELGADEVIDGGQTKNPSAGDFVKAFEKVNAEDIFVLPNNGNIILTAKQAATLYPHANIHALESKNIGEGYAALTMLSYDSGEASEIEESLTEAMKGVVTGMVSRAIRNVHMDGVDVKENEYMGFTDKKVFTSDCRKENAAAGLTDALIQGHEFLIVIFGKNTSPEEKEAYRAQVRKKHPRTELYEIDGEQDVYDFILILE